MANKLWLVFIWVIVLPSSAFLHKLIMPRLNGLARKIVIIIAIVVIIASLLLTGYVLFFADSDAAWHAEYIGYSDLHEYSTGSSQTIVLIDSGISYDLRDRVRENLNFTDGNDYDVNGHGTMMLSILKGVDGKVEGIAPDVNVVSMKVVDDHGKTEKETLLKALETVLTMENVDIVNMSFGKYNEDADIAAVVDEMIDKGIIVVASSGDYQTDAMLFPACMERVISVGALSANGYAWDGTNSPDECDILAPGDEIPALNMNGNVETTSGTSQATVLISGYISLLRDHAEQKQIKMDYEDIIAILQEIQSAKVSYSKAFER